MASRWPIGLACVYFVAAAVTVWLTRFSGGVAFVWVATALLTAHLCLAPREDWGRALLLCGVGSVIATSALGLGPVAAPFLAVINMSEAVIGALLLRRWIARPGGFESIGEVARFAVAVGLVAPLATAPFAAAVVSAITSNSFLFSAPSWFVGHSLGALTIGPLAILVARGEIAEWRREANSARMTEALGLCAAMFVITVAVFAQHKVPLLFLPLFPALLATFRIGRLGAAASIVMLIAIGVPFSLYGLGPVAIVHESVAFRSLYFQFYVAIIVLTVLPAAAELQNRRRLFGALHDSERRYRLLAENTTDVIVWSQLDTTRRYVSPAAKSLFGYDPSELVGTKPLDFVHPDDRQSYGEILRSLANGSLEQAVTHQRYRHRDGRWLWIEASFSTTRDPATRVADGYVVSLRDVTARRSAEEALKVSEERLALALDSGSDGMWDWDIATGDIQLSSHWYQMLGYEHHEIEPHIRSWESLVHPDDAEQSRKLLSDHVRGFTPTYECEYRLKTKSGDYAWTLARGKVVSRADDGRALRMVGTHMDITRRKQAESQIEHMAHHDALTGLPNRALFRQRLRLIGAQAAINGRAFAVLACDLDRFKSVNDTRGHIAGDAVLRTVADRLTSAIRTGDMVARLGGDEFAIILHQIDSPQDAGRTAQRIIDLIGEPIDFEGQATGVGVSVGVALGQGDPADQIFKNADVALYEAKAAGRNVYRFFEQGMDAALDARNMLEIDLRTAARNDGFSLHYQPIVSLETGKPCGFEALMRWLHPTLGMIPPTDFIPIAEETGLIVGLGAWALRQACIEATNWPSDIRVAVNVSAVQFQRPGLEQSVIEALGASGLAPHRLELEITESVLMQNAERVVSTLMRLRALGVRIALDDFGTGYSSLSYLRRFPFNKIKIDRSFIVEIADPEVAAIVRAIVDLGERSGATTVAEGVETAEQLELVRREGCVEVQGYFFSKPLCAADATAFIGERRARDAKVVRNARSA